MAAFRSRFDARVRVLFANDVHRNITTISVMSYAGRNLLARMQTTAEEQRLRRDYHSYIDLIADRLCHQYSPGQTERMSLYGRSGWSEQRGLDQIDTARLAEQQAKTKAAEDKSKKLLLSILSKEQKKQFKSEGNFFAKGSSTGTMYLLKPQRTYGIDMYLLGKKVGSICVTASDSAIPVYDMMAAQKLLIENDEPHFVKIANVRG